jgi:transcriptional regulator GlxA family with amidase domain
LTAKRVRVAGPVHTAQGLVVPTSAARSLRTPDIVVVPALGALTAEALSDVLCRDDIRRAGALLRKWHAAVVTIAAACTGTFLLAEAGLLHDRTVTTSWWLGPYFRSRYPTVELDDGRMVVQSGNVVTAGAALAHFDLALWIIYRSSPSLASLTARYLIMDPRSSQTSYVIPDHLKHNDPTVERFERRVRHGPLGFAGFLFDRRPSCAIEWN